MVEFNFNLIRISFQRAMLGSIIPAIRAISFGIKNNILNVKVIVDKEPNEDEKDMFYTIAGEVSGDFPGLNSDVFIIVDNKNSFENLVHLDHLVFARFEE